MDCREETRGEGEVVEEGWRWRRCCNVGVVKVDEVDDEDEWSETDEDGEEEDCKESDMLRGCTERDGVTERGTCLEVRSAVVVHR